MGAGAAAAAAPADVLATDSRPTRGRASGAGVAGGDGRKPLPREASRSETNEPSTPAGAASGAALAYSAMGGSGVTGCGRTGILGNDSGAGEAAWSAAKSRPNPDPDVAVCGPSVKSPDGTS